MGMHVHESSQQVGCAATAAVVMSNVPTYIGKMELANTTAAKAYLQIFWKAAADVIVGTTAADVIIGLPANGGAVLPFYGDGWKTMGTAWCAAGTTTRTGSVEALIDVVIWKRS